MKTYESLYVMVRPTASVQPRLVQTKSLNGLSGFERGENFLNNGILHFVFKLSQSNCDCSYCI